MAVKKLKKTTTKTSPVKKTTTKKSSKTFTSSVVAEPASKSTVESPSRSFRLKRSYAVTIIGILIIVSLVYLGRNLIVAAMVNGQPISRLAVVAELEKQGGKSALDSLVTKQLILQEAKKKNIVVSQGDIDAELKNISKNLEQQGQKLDQVLALQGMTKEQLVDQIKLQKMLEKMVGKIEVTDKEVDEYIASNQESLPQDQDEKTMKTNVKSSLVQQKMNTKAQELLENLRKNAKINYFVQY